MKQQILIADDEADTGIFVKVSDRPHLFLSGKSPFHLTNKL